MMSGKCENHQLNHSYKLHGNFKHSFSGGLSFFYPKRYICTIRGNIGITYRRNIFKGAQTTKTAKITPTTYRKQRLALFLRFFVNVNEYLSQVLANI